MTRKAEALSDPPEAMVSRLARPGRVLVTSHTNPDGDAVGSELALADVLTGAGSEVSIWNRDPTPGIYGDLDPDDRIVVLGDGEPPEPVEGFDYAILLECPTPERCGLEGLLGALPLMNVDHHLGNSDYGEWTWVDARFAAVGLMVFRLADALGIALEDATPNRLLAALVSDTGGFRFSNADRHAFLEAARLVERGASPEDVAHMLYEQRPLAHVLLLREMLGGLELHHDGTVATAVLLPQMYEAAGATHEDAEGLIDVPRSIAGVRTVALIRELAPGRYKASLRSRGAVDVQEVASRLQGGGHRNAAGCEISGELDAVRRRLVEELSSAVDAAPETGS